MSDLMSIEAAATKLDVSTGTLRKLINRGSIQLVRFSKRNVRVPVASVDAFLTGPTPCPAPRGTQLGGGPA